jgi:hypothetical protein
MHEGRLLYASRVTISTLDVYSSSPKVRRNFPRMGFVFSDCCHINHFFVGRMTRYIFNCGKKLNLNLNKTESHSALSKCT